ncbi:calcium/proton exchanger [Calocera viscosa TUFC12733]|uniref:Calcium/proton exchanger n=1 Tax=Calocera viscosa (strain TUFC12733) TaxID=1330018 RepID=A0A167KX97_CALVF|nr:calcium/proton exchanger [Calocera viscosa TUFC12733]
MSQVTPGGRRSSTLVQRPSNQSRANTYPQLEQRGRTRKTSDSLPSPVTADPTDSAKAARRWRLSLDFAQAMARFKRAHLTPPRKLKAEAPTTYNSIMTIIKSSWLNLLLVFIPVGWALHFINVTPVAVFVTTFLAIIPLAALLAFSTEELAIRVGETLGGLLNATLGNAVELIVAIIALTQCKLTVVQSSLIGSILSNLLLVLGMCFYAGGVKYSEQGFLVTPSQINSELLFLSVVAVLLPGAFDIAVRTSNSSDNSTSDDVPTSVLASDILQMSHGVAVILLFIYICYLIFTLWSHAGVMNATSEESTRYPPDFKGPKMLMRNVHKRWNESFPRSKSPTKHRPALPFPLEANAEGPVPSDSPAPPDGFASAPELHGSVEDQERLTHARMEDDRLETGEGSHVANGYDGPTETTDDDEQELQMNIPVTIGLLAIVTVLVGVTAEFLVDSIDGVTATGAISEEWVGLILLPIVGNAAEHVTAVTVAIKDKLDLSIAVAVGSSIQIAVFVIPFIVVLAWIMGKPLTMLFDPFESVVLFLTVLTVNYTTQDSKSNWLEGMVLMMLYVIVAVSFWFYPGYNPSQALNLPC